MPWGILLAWCLLMDLVGRQSTRTIAGLNGRDQFLHPPLTDCQGSTGVMGFDVFDRADFVDSIFPYNSYALVFQRILSVIHGIVGPGLLSNSQQVSAPCCFIIVRSSQRH
jgi:hypothetical protein